MIVKGQIRNRAGMELALLAGKSMGKWGELLAKRPRRMAHRYVARLRSRATWPASHNPGSPIFSVS